ncbi:MAG TPA: peptide transporter, partial [Anaeromyxobacteraceae bacterium]|nr:peptide transporter [Anaeromyxobacteraceae bacterium]
MATPSTQVPARPTAALAPRRELTARALAISILVAIVMGTSFPPVVLKIGYGPNISVSAAFFGFIALAITAALTRVGATVYEANMAQTAGTAAG